MISLMMSEILTKFYSTYYLSEKLTLGFVGIFGRLAPTIPKVNVVLYRTTNALTNVFDDSSEYTYAGNDLLS